MNAKKKLTPAKAQRAIDALVALIETGEFKGNDLRLLDDACDLIRLKASA